MIAGCYIYTAGAKVVLNGRREEMLSQTAAKIDPTGKNIAYVAAIRFG
jgi:NADP-dependent 3-hydroxy acid dehydrogenase YdfG